MSRTLEDDFDDDDLPSGALDLETGSHVGGSGVSSSYDGGGIDFDDDLDGDGGGGSLELDIPGGSKHGPPSAPVNSRPPAQPQASQAPQGMRGQPSHGPSAGSMGGGGPTVPDLAFDNATSRGAPPARPSGQLPAQRPSGQLPAQRPSGQLAAQPSLSHAPGPVPSTPPTSSGRALGGGPSAPPAPHSDSGAFGPGPAASAGGYGTQHGGNLPPARPSAAAVIAKYPAPPTGIGHAPMYTIRVVIRQLELRSELESLRRRRSPDVPLYESALRAYDSKTFRLGMAINVAALVIATFIFFLPVIIRFMRAD